MSHENTGHALLEPFEPSSTELLDVLRRRVDDSMLDEISQADYGEDAEAHLAALKRLHATDDIAPVNWVPMEVLELIRWSQPSDPSWKPGSIGERGHLMRAFCCAILLRTAAEPKNYEYFDGENQTVVQLVDSAIELGGEVEDAALRFLCWRILNLDRDDCEYPFFAMAILLLATHLRKIDADCLVKLAGWVVAEESCVRNDPNRIRPDDDSTWLLGLTFHTQCHAVWIRLTKDVLSSFSGNGMSTSSHQAITEIAQRLAAASSLYRQPRGTDLEGTSHGALKCDLETRTKSVQLFEQVGRAIGTVCMLVAGVFGVLFLYFGVRDHGLYWGAGATVVIGLFAALEWLRNKREYQKDGGM